MKIALISDTHFADAAVDFNTNGAAACAWIDNLGADLAVHLGDITADGVLDHRHFETARRVLDGLLTPLRLLPGNHDIGDNPPASARHAESHHEGGVRPEALALYRNTFGADRWRFTAGAWTVVGLNAQLYGLGDAEAAAQDAWLAETLAEVDGPLGLMLHKPLFRTAPEDGDTHHRYIPPTPRLRLYERLRGQDLRFVVSGHTHQARRLMHDGVEHVWAPSTAFIIPDRLQERIGDKRVGAMTLTLDGDRHRFELVSPEGVLMHDLDDYAAVYPRLALMVERSADPQGPAHD